MFCSTDYASTEYAPSERADWDVLHSQLRSVRKNQVIREQLEHSQESLLLLNTHRQIVFANQACRKSLKIEDAAEIYGYRPGEVMRCKFAIEGEGGCGTSKHCRVCGGVNAVLKSIYSGVPSSQRFVIDSVDSEEPIRLIVSSIPVWVASHSLVLVSMLEDGLDIASTVLGREVFRLQNLVLEIESA